MSARWAVVVLLLGMTAQTGAAELPGEEEIRLCVPAPRVRLSMAETSSVARIASAAQETFCRPIVVQSSVLEQQVVVPPAVTDVETAADARKRLVAALARSGLAFETRGRIWRITAAKAVAAAQPERQCIPPPPGKKFLFDLRGGMTVAAMGTWVQAMSCRPVVVSPRVADRKVNLFMPRVLVTVAEAEALFRELVVASGLMLDSKSALLIDGAE